jgi:uncharacterized cupin superfamily protein
VNDRQPLPEAELAETLHGFVPHDDGWFVVNVGETVGYANAQAGTYQMFESPERRFPDFGIGIHVLWPGQPNARYHQEAAQEGFLVLSGECVVLVEEQERTLRAWDYFHCPGGTRHILVGAGDGPCAVLMVGSRPADNPIFYPVSEVASRHGASVAAPTTEPSEAYTDWPGPFEPTRFRWPPERAYDQ